MDDYLAYIIQIELAFVGLSCKKYKKYKNINIVRLFGQYSRFCMGPAKLICELNCPKYV
jgi:hypothetical protein